MKKRDTFLSKGIVLILFMALVVQVNGAKRRFVPLAPTAISDYNYTIANDAQVSDRILEFDLYLLDTDATQPFEMAAVQAGILVDPSIYNGGTITATINASTSQFTNTAQDPSSITFTQSANCIKLAARPNPGAGSGSILSTTAPGTRICRIRLTNTVAFTSGSKANLTFCFTISPYPTKISQYISGLSTVLTSDATNCFSNAANITLNAAPTAYTVSGSGSYCQNGTGVPVSLSGSDVGVNYQLYNGATAVGTAVAGTGSAISFGNQTAGTFTVTATNAATLLTASMTGNAVITANPIITPSVSIAASANPSTTGISITYTATPTNGGTAPTYQWYVNSVAVGTATSVNTYSYVPTNGDLVSVSMNSNATPCLVGSPVMSNTITQSVSVGTGLDQNGNVVFKVYSTNKNIFVNTYVLAKDVYVYDMLGSAIMLENNVLGVKKFDLNSYPSAYYVVKIFTADNVYSQKVLLK